MSAAALFSPREKLPRARPGALALAAIILAGAWASASTHYLPTHDAIGWHGIYHYYAEVLWEGRFPWWNPYGRGGEPFFPYLQLLGILQPTYLPFIVLQKVAGLASVTAFALHYFLQIYLFALGIYLVAHALARNAATAFLFALIALAGLLPALFIQNGLMNGCTYVPLAHYFLLRFLETGDPGRRGPWLFAFAVTIAVAVNAWVPAPMLLFLTCMAAGLLLAARAELRAAFWYLRTRAGLRWAGLATVISGFLAAPVVALLLEIRLVDELFPLIRLIQHGDMQLPQCFATDLRSGILSSRFTGDAVVSIVPQDLAGLFLAPVEMGSDLWQMVFFAGGLTLISAAFGVLRAASRWKAAIVLLLVLSLCATTNFGGSIYGAPHFLQRAVRALLPFLHMTDVVQVYGALMYYALILLAVLGMPYFVASTAALLTALAAPLAFKFLPAWGVFGPTGALSWLAWGLAALGILVAAARRPSAPLRRMALLVLVLVVLAGEIFVFEAFYLVLFERASPSHYRFLERNGLLMGSRDATFRMQREPYAFPDTDQFELVPDRRFPKMVGMYGRDLLEHKKSAFPNLMRRHSGEPEAWRRFPWWDNIFSTRYYYDYVANVRPLRQLALSGVTAPILQVVRRGASVAARSPAEAAALLNEHKPGAPELVVMSGYVPTPEAAQAADRCFAARDRLVQMTDDERSAFAAAIAARKPGVAASAVEVLEQDENGVVVRATAPAEGGFLYYADGYSRHWRASVDGAEAPILLANLAYKAVPLPPGTHTVEFRYRPTLYRAAIQLYALGLVLAALVFGAALFRRFASSPLP